MMAHHGVPCLDIHLRSPSVGPTHGDFLRPAWSWILRSYNICDLAMSEAVGGNSWRIWEGGQKEDSWHSEEGLLEWSVSFVQSANPTLVMGVHAYCRGGGGVCKIRDSLLSSWTLRWWRWKQCQKCSPHFPSEGFWQRWSSCPPPFLWQYTCVNRQLLILNILIPPDIPLSLSIVTSRDPWVWRGSGVPPTPPPPCNPRVLATISKRDKLTDHLPLAWAEKFDNSPYPMPCAKTDARPREDPATRDGRVNLTAKILGQRPSIPNVGDESGL